jgi:hypothetical protein
MNKAKYILLVSLACLLGCRQTNSQALPTATAPGAYISVGTTYSFFESGYGQQKVQGKGIYADINPVRQAGLEAEARWLKQSQSPNVRQSTYLIGPRIQFRRGPYTPYVKTLAGLSHFEFPYEMARGRYFVIAPGAGVDLMLGNDLKIRLIDVEYQQWPQFTFGTISPYGVSIGVSYRVFNGSR